MTTLTSLNERIKLVIIHIIIVIIIELKANSGVYRLIGCARVNSEGYTCSLVVVGLIHNFIHSPVQQH